MSEIVKKIVGRKILPCLLLVLCLGLGGCGTGSAQESIEAADRQISVRQEQPTVSVSQEEAVAQADEPDSGEISLEEIPDYDGEPYVVLNNNRPEIDAEELEPYSYEIYSTLDELDRCGETEAVIGEDLMPDEKRESISRIKPSGWHSVEYDNVDGGSLYNRCHLIGYQLTGENANECNLITGTRYMNVEGMLPFEDLVADYIRESGNHVFYRVTPIFEGDDLVASGVHMEAMSVEDSGRAVCFNVYVYNVQPGIEIDYATGDSRESTEPAADSTKTAVNPSEISGNDAKAAATSAQTSAKQDYVLNTNTKKFHKPSCSSVDDIKPSNRQDVNDTRENLLSQGYDPCGRCNP